jgi:uncharacterized membrane protein YqaE (UPF0057 family)
MLWLNSLIQFGGILCLTGMLTFVVGGGFWVYRHGTLEPVMKGMGILLMLTSCIIPLAAVFAFVGFLLDAILAMEEVLSLAGAVVGAAIGAWLGRLLFSRSSI